MNLTLVLGGFLATIAVGLVVIALLKRVERKREAFEDAHLTPMEKLEPQVRKSARRIPPRPESIGRGNW
jgi:hypothetical protein